MHLFHCMHTHGRALIGSLAITLVLALVSPASAGAPTDALKQQVDQAVKVLSDPALKARPDVRRAQVRKIAETIFDYPDTARRALGQHWTARSPQEQQDFVKLFADLLDRAYFSKIEQYQGERVNYTGETMNGSEATVKTAVAIQRGSEMPVDYRMHLKDGRWLVYDVVIEGVSLVANYRTQFNKIVTTESYDALVQRLRAKDAPEPAASPSQSRVRER